MDIYSQLLEVLKGKENQILTTSQLKDMLYKKFCTNKPSVIPSDYCYNRINEGNKGIFTKRKHLFKRINKGEYKYLGEKYPYTGRIYHKPKGMKSETVAGEWENGQYKLSESSLLKTECKLEFDDNINRYSPKRELSLEPILLI